MEGGLQVAPPRSLFQVCQLAAALGCGKSLPLPQDLMVDVNRAWDFKTACEGVKLLEAWVVEDLSSFGEFSLFVEAFKPRWLEEPASRQGAMIQLTAIQISMPILTPVLALIPIGIAAIGYSGVNVKTDTSTNADSKINANLASRASIKNSTTVSILTNTFAISMLNSNDELNIHIIISDTNTNS